METESKTKRGAVVATQSTSTGVLLGFAMMWIRAKHPDLIPWDASQDVIFLGALIGVATGALHSIMKLLPGEFAIGKNETKKGNIPG